MISSCVPYIQIGAIIVKCVNGNGLLATESQMKDTLGKYTRFST